MPAPGWKYAGKYKRRLALGGQPSKKPTVKKVPKTVKRVKGGRFVDKKTGRFVSRKKAERILKAPPKYIDVKTGKRVSEKNAKRRLKRAAAKSTTVEVDAYYQNFHHAKGSQLTESVYRAKLPTGAARTLSNCLTVVDTLYVAMMAAGHGKAEKKKYKGAWPYPVKYFGYLEGQAVDEGTGKRVRAGTGLYWKRNLIDAVADLKDKLTAIFEGASLKNAASLFATTGSDKRKMEQGPDTIIMTAVYAPDVPVPYLSKESGRVEYL